MQEQIPVFHVGLSKCASTFLQKSIFPQFRNYSNIAFAPEKEKYYLFRRDMDIDIYRSIVSKYIVNPEKNSRHLLVSCEDYSELLFRGFRDVFFKWQSLDPDQYHYSNELITENITRAFPRAKIIFIIREQINWAISRHKMNYRGGKVCSNINDFLTEPLEGYDETIRRYHAAFGKENVLVLPYEKLIVDQAEFFNNLCSFIKPDMQLRVPGKRINEGSDLQRAIEYERYKNKRRISIKSGRSTRSIIQSTKLILDRLLTSLMMPCFYVKYGDRKFEIEVSEKIRDMLSPKLQETNSRVEALTGLDLARFGYTTKPQNS